MENIYKKIKLSIAIILASLFFQNCTAWPALTALLALAGGDKGGALLLVPPGGGGGESGGSGEAGSEPTSPNAPSNLTIPNITQTITVGIELDPKITPTFDGTVTNCTISPALPAGLSINPTTCEISGTPTGPGGTAFTEYTITATNESGSTTATVGFAVEDGSPPTIGGFSNPADPFVQGVAITPISPSSTTGVITNCTVSPALPSGLTLNTNTCVISGTPSVEASSQTYTITPSNSSGSGETQTVTFSINPAPPSNLTASITGTPTYYEDVAIAPIVISGDNIGTCAINPALPSGLTLDPNTCTISGTPDIGSAIGDTTYTITISNAGGVDETIDIAFTIEAGITGVSVNDAGPHVFWVDVTIDSIVFTATGGSITENGCQLEGSPSSLPTGLTLSRTSSSTCTISGTPEETATIQTYTVRVSNPGGHSDQTAQFQVNGAPTGPLSSSVTGTQVYTQGDAITPVTLTSAGGGPITSCSASPSLPDGLTLSNPPTNGTTCTISGAPTANATDTTYTITASNPSGSITNTITFRVEGGPQITPSATGPFVYYKDQPSAITPITFTNDGGAITGCSSSPVLPSGLSINNTTCEISGNPTVAVPTATNYTITAQAGSNNSNSVVLSITVHDEPGTITASNAGPINFIRGTAIEPINFTKPDGGPITDCSVTVGTLPAGLEVVRVDDNTCRLQGTPTAEKANETYTVRASNPAGGNDATVAFAVLGAPSNLQAVNLTTPYYVNIDPANPITFTADGGAIQSCTISEAVPTGMNFNTTTCEISGTPTAAKSSTTYTITATNSAGSTLVDVTFAVEPAPADITASITDPAVFHQGQSITPITFTKASGGQITSCTLIAPAELPTGLSLGVTGGGDSCTISGTPTDPSVVNQTYTVRAGNPAGHVDASVQFRIDGAPTSLTGTTTLLLYHNFAMTAVDYTASGGEITTCTIDPTIGGLTFTKTAANTCTLSGSPDAIKAAGDHTLSATNPSGTSNLTVNIEVRGAPTAVAFTSPGSALTAGSPITPIAPTTLDGGAPTTCISDPALPTGLMLNPTTCVISGTPDTSLIIDPAQEYTITATNPAGSINNTISLSVYPQAPTNLTF
ncbi:MAG: putative Ig domain-containing protein, partial [Leptospira sp.]|nr:putative Ig domain-containing protein [Leptospira sp.]